MSLFDGELEGTATGTVHVTILGLGSTLASAPLAERMRPRTLNEYSGQEHLLGPGTPLRVQIERESQGTGELGSIIFWGPP